MSQRFRMQDISILPTLLAAMVMVFTGCDPLPNTPATNDVQATANRSPLESTPLVDPKADVPSDVTPTSAESPSSVGALSDVAGSAPDSQPGANEKTEGTGSAELTSETPDAASDSSPQRRAPNYLPPNRSSPAIAGPQKTDKQVVEERKAREAAKKRGEITFDDLKFEMEKGAAFKSEMLTSENKELDGKVWKLRGFILPTTLFSQSGIREFVLVRDNQECCFGPGAALYDCVIVKMAPEKTINYTTRVVTVKGKLEIDTESFQYPDDGGHYAVYKMTAEEVK